MTESAEPQVRVVIAEDEAIIRRDLREILLDENYDVVGECARGDDAVEMVRALRPDVVILDIMMPGIDGLEAARRINDERLAATLILTAFSQREHVIRARDAGALAYLVKPFQPTDLIPAIEVALGRHAELQLLHEQAATLEDRLEVRKLLDRAKGRLMDEHHLGEQDAFRFIQTTAMAGRLPMSDIAKRIIDGTLTPDAS